MKELRRILETLKNTPRAIDKTKICRKCGNHYDEAENFNWSCRTHSSVWNGTMWWCCGKKNKADTGCRYSKHEKKDIFKNAFKSLT